MKREIKFKAWNGDEMNYNIVVGKFGIFWVNPGINNDGLNEQDSACINPFNTKFPDCTIALQFTGLADKDGNEIYEGDLFKIGAEKDVFEVRFEHGCFLAFRNGKQYGIIGELQVCFITVIGNIYQNPELVIN